MAETVKERPIIFTPESVKAILDGRKTQTRRIIKRGAFHPFFVGLADDRKCGGYPGPNRYHYGKLLIDWPLSCFDSVDPQTGIAKFELQNDVDDYCDIEIPCPYGRVGERLWVRESFSVTHDGKQFGLLYKSDNALAKYWPNYDKGKVADIDAFALRHANGSGLSPLFMPRWASRIDLVLTDVRVERVQDISEEDAQAEGIYECTSGFWWISSHHQKWLERNSARDAYFRLWDSINAKTYPADSNPYVWVLAYDRIEATP